MNQKEKEKEAGKEFGKGITSEKFTEAIDSGEAKSKAAEKVGWSRPTYNIKKIISGDTLRGELKYKPSFDFTPITRLWFSCNENP